MNNNRPLLEAPASVPGGATYQLQFRVHVKDGQATEIEIHVQLRKFDGTPDAAKSVRFPWPA